MSVKFEKWQALGNDYVIVERDVLPFELSPSRIRRICDPHTGVGSDGVLELTAADEPGFVAQLRIFNPDGSEAELSGNGAREAILYLRRRGWTDETQFSIRTAAGEVRPTILDDRTCSVVLGRARLESADYPSGGPDGRGELSSAGRMFQFQHVQVGNPQCAIFVESLDELETLDLGLYGPQIESNGLFPNRTNVSFFTQTGAGEIRARIFERGVGETSSSGTGSCGAAVAMVLRGGASPVTVRLDGGELLVEVDESLQMTQTGWAEPVYTAEFSPELLDALQRLE
ncbi:MAG TPA: diaminopimelate epimerase [Baekduia sp.]|nr:diaminopimelate epimerase [Baekduia sp.]